MTTLFQFYLTYGPDTKDPLGTFIRTPPGRTHVEAIDFMIDTLNKLKDVQWVSLSRFHNNFRKPKNWRGACGILLKCRFQSSKHRDSDPIPEEAHEKFMTLLQQGALPVSCFCHFANDPMYSLLTVYREEVTDPKQHGEATANLVAAMSHLFAQHGLDAGSFAHNGGFVLDLSLPHLK